MMLVSANRGRATGVLLCAAALGALIYSHQPRSIRTFRAEYGSCRAEASINGMLFEDVLLDTGAHGTVVLGHNHALKLGIAPHHYPIPYGSANGIGHEAQVQIHELRIGDFVARDLMIAVTEVDQNQVLVGFEILNQLHFTLSGHTCELRT